MESLNQLGDRAGPRKRTPDEPHRARRAVPGATLAGLVAAVARLESIPHGSRVQCRALVPHGLPAKRCRTATATISASPSRPATMSSPAAGGRIDPISIAPPSGTSGCSTGSGTSAAASPTPARRTIRSGCIMSKPAAQLPGWDRVLSSAACLQGLAMKEGTFESTKPGRRVAFAPK